MELANNLLESLAGGHAKGEEVAPGVKLGTTDKTFQTLILIKRCLKP